MRRCVFLTVSLSLVLSLLKGVSTDLIAAPQETTTPATTGVSTELTTASQETTTPATTGVSTESTTASQETTTPATTEINTESTTTSQETTNSATTEINTESTTASQETTNSATTEIKTESTTTSQETKSSATTVTNTSPSATMPPGDLCHLDPCGKKLAQCVPLNSIFTCLCQYGFYYSNKDCHRGIIFPGVITMKESYSDNVQIVNSVEYEEVFQNATKFFKAGLGKLPGFVETVIVEIQPLGKGRTARPMSVTVTNLFMENSTVTNDTVTSAIREVIGTSPYVSQYRGASYCAAFNCDDRTTNCEENMFPKCICKSLYSKTKWDDRSCSDCSKDCSEEENEYCAKEKGVPVCKCMPDFESKNGKCVSCPVGYSGENCKNNRELILIIVGSVFGAIILSLVIAVSVVSVRAKHKQDPEKKRLIKSEYSNPNTSEDRQTTMFPRVQTTTSGHANPGYQPNNPYEMRSSDRGRFPDRDYDDLYEVSREPEGFRMQSSRY